jgi:hypothetical protein
MRKTDRIAPLATLAVVACSTACMKGDPLSPLPVNENELITTVRVHLESATQQLELAWVDIDGPGGGAPEIIADTLRADSAYSVHVELLNESAYPAVNISDEVLAEAEDHQLFYLVNGTSAIFTYADSDPNGHPIGLHASCSAGTSGSGSLTLILRHQPDKSATGVSAGDVTNAGGETDVEVILPLVIL